MTSLTRARRHEELQNVDKSSRLSSSSIFDTLRRSRNDLSTNSIPRSSISIQPHQPIKESIQALEKRFKDLNISTSYISDDSAEVSESPPPIEESRTETKTTQSPPVRVEIGTQTEESNTRLDVLSTIGRMYDMHYLDSTDTGDAINLAMRRDDTCDLIVSLLRSRKTLEGQGQFLKLWLNTRKSNTCAPLIIKPRPMYAPAPMDSPDEDISLISTQTMVRTSSDQSSRPPRFTPPNPSPPLFPTALQFNDPMYHQPSSFYRQSGSGPTPPLLMASHPTTSKHSLTPNSSSTLTGTPFDTLMLYSSGIEPSPPPGTAD